MKRIMVLTFFSMLAACGMGSPEVLPGTNPTSTLFVLPPQWTLTPTFTPTPQEVNTATMSSIESTETMGSAGDVNEWTDQAALLMKQGDYSGAIKLWNKVIRADPGNADAYYQRATCFLRRSEEQNILDFYANDVDQALRDIDTAISLRGDIGDYYSLRQSVYIGIVSIEDVEIDREYLANIALDNARKAYALGTSIEPYPDRIIITDLLFTARCEEALDELELLLKATPEDDSSRGGLLHIQSQVFACLGRLDDALNAINESMFNNINMGFKRWLKAVYLYQIGRYDESLSLVNELIAAGSGGGGERYYLRAAIYFAQDKKDLALQDLEMGKMNTWMRYEMLPYVEAQIALQEGDKEKAIDLLLYDETTFEPLFFPTRRKVQKQLAGLGVTPLNPTPSVSITATPIP